MRVSTIYCVRIQIGTSDVIISIFSYPLNTPYGKGMIMTSNKFTSYLLYYLHEIFRKTYFVELNLCYVDFDAMCSMRSIIFKGTLVSIVRHRKLRKFLVVENLKSMKNKVTKLFIEVSLVGVVGMGLIGP